ncbi:MAG: deoxyribose-phosphate aldolase [Bacteroidales bacterium]|nr:deoxyribose-phosphate aldolase [Bacteroidales bacterium]
MQYKDYAVEVNTEKMTSRLKEIHERSYNLKDKALFKKIFSLIDLTSLDVTDTAEKIQAMVKKVNVLPERFPDLPNVAAICVYPSFIPVLTNDLKIKTVMKASVGASFPSSQTYLDIKLQEVARILEEGADEVDIVISVGKFLAGKNDEVFNEIHEIKKIMGNKHLKVILETGAIKDLLLIKLASFIAMEAGADFIKTSTGKNGDGASPEAVYIMCQAIKEFYDKTGRKIGIKPSGGISDASTGIQYYLIVNEILGNDWINPHLFRLGASRLANNLLGENYF